MASLSPLDALNERQKAAVTFGVRQGAPFVPPPPLLVVAGAGTGKTMTLAHRVAHLLLAGADPRRTLLLTFSRRAAEEMIRRVERICGEVASIKARLAEGLDWAGTFHAVGSRLLRHYAEEVGLPPGFTVLDRGDAADLLDLVRDELRLAQGERRFPRKGTCLSIYSLAVNSGDPLDQVLRRQFPWCLEWRDALKTLFKAYGEAKRDQAVLDYDDLLLLWERLMRVPGLATDVARRFDLVLVDEYQDTNPLQAAILKALKPEGRGLTVVGDDAQAIYGFRAATVRNILDFPGSFAPPAEIVTLELNYRSTQPILDGANGVIGLARERFTKSLAAARPGMARPRLVEVADDGAQVDHVVGRILELREAGVPLLHQAVLFRTAHHSAALEVELVRRNIPFVKWGGLKFLEAAHVKDVMAMLRWAENLRDRVAAFRTLQLLPGIGPAIARRLLGSLDESGPAGLDRLEPPAAARHLWSGFAETMKGLVQEPAWPGDLERVRAFYDPLLPELHENARLRLLDLDQLLSIALRSPGRERFLTDLTLDPPEAVGDEAGPPLRDEEQLVLSTIHSAKGQEWKAVFVLNCVDGCIPSDMATGSEAEIEEERRLLYVAMTRAKDELDLMVPQRFFVLLQHPRGDRHLRANRTRFIPDRLLPVFDRVRGGPRGEAPGDQKGPLPRLDLRADLAGMWD